MTNCYDCPESIMRGKSWEAAIDGKPSSCSYRNRLIALVGPAVAQNMAALSPRPDVCGYYVDSHGAAVRLTDRRHRTMHGRHLQLRRPLMRKRDILLPGWCPRVSERLPQTWCRLCMLSIVRLGHHSVLPGFGSRHGPSLPINSAASSGPHVRRSYV